MTNLGLKEITPFAETVYRIVRHIPQGKTGGYAWGTEKKRNPLKKEGAIH